MNRHVYRGGAAGLLAPLSFPGGPLIKVELQDVLIVEVIPGHSQIFAGSLFSGALPGLDMKASFD